MDIDQIMEYATAVQAYQLAVDGHEGEIASSLERVAEKAKVRADAETHLRSVIEKLGSDPMNVLKKQRVKVDEADREAVLNAVDGDSGTEADVARDTGLPIEVVRLSLRHLSRIGWVRKDGRGASAVWSAVQERVWSEQTAPSIADKVNELIAADDTKNLAEPERDPFADLPDESPF